ncbi:hypothetical protein EC988_009795, partial [Linderina pennispora]
QSPSPSATSESSVIEQQQQQQQPEEVAVESAPEPIDNVADQAEQSGEQVEQHSQPAEQPAEPAEQPGEREPEPEPVIPRTEAPTGVEMNDALAKARAIALKLGSISQPPLPSFAPSQPDPPADAHPTEDLDRRNSPPRKRSYDSFRRSASPSDQPEAPRGYKRDRSSDRTMRPQRQRRYEDALEFTVPARYVGLVIGRKGENLRHIEQQHGVRVQVNADADKRDPERRIIIEGPPDCCQAAKQA